MIFHPGLVSDSENSTLSDFNFYVTSLDTALEKAFFACKPANLLTDQIKRVGNTLEISGKSIVIGNKNIFIVGAGKATFEMTEALISILGEEYKKGIINIPQDTRQSATTLLHTEIIKAGHPIPDNETFNGTQKQIHLLDSLSSEDIVFVLISGGASALFELPDPMISNEDIIETYRRLVTSGLSITSINKIRKFLSSVKGGKLLEKTKAQVYGLLLSDVLGDDLSAIGSGPTITEKISSDEILSLLNTASLKEILPESVLKFIYSVEDNQITPMNSDKSFYHREQNFLLGSNKNFLETLKQHLKAKSIHSTICSRIFSGEAKEIGSFLVNYCTFPYSSIPKCLLYGGESVVTIEDTADEKTSRGGRNQELVLSFILNFLQTNPLMNVIILSLGTDGIDGASDNAGAIFCSEYSKNTDLKRTDLFHHLNHHNSAQSLHSSYYIKTGPTGTNVSDILIVLLY